jgi:hypothetical protein
MDAINPAMAPATTRAAPAKPKRWCVVSSTCAILTASSN